MADISKLQINGTTYDLKDSVARAAVSNLETAVSSSLTFKGVINNDTDLEGIVMSAAQNVGDTYKIGTNFISNQYGPLQNGDMFVCIGIMDWTVLQNNIDVFTGATTEYGGMTGLVPAPSTEDKNKYLAGDGTWKKVNTDIQLGSISDLIQD